MPQSSTEPIRLGIMPPLYGLGASHGPEISWAGQIARAEINAAGGILGRPLELIIADDGGLPETATRTAGWLLDMGCLALIGTHTAVTSLVTEPREIPYLNYAFRDRGPDGRLCFSFGALPNQRIERLIPYMARMAGPRLFLVGNTQAWSRVCVETATRALREHGGDLVDAACLITDTASIETILDRLEDCRAHVLLPFLEDQEQLDLLTRLHRRGLKERVAVVLCNFDETMAARLAPEVRVGLYSSNTYFMSVETAANRRYLSTLAALNDVDGIWPLGKGMLTSVGEAAYLCIQAFAQAANAAGSLAPSDLVAALEQTRLDAPQGKVRMQPATHQAHLHHYLARCDFDGAFRVIKQFGACAPAIAERDAQRAPVAASNNADQSEQEGIIAIAVAGVGSDGRISFVNRTLLQHWGFSDTHQLKGVPITQLWEDADALAAIMPSLSRMPQWSGPLTARCADGRLKRLMVVAEPMLHGSDTLTGYTLACVDTRSLNRRVAENELLWRASHDSLTGLPNRTMIHERLSRALQRSKMQEHGVALLFVDLDGFRLVNDSHGHATGDELLKNVAKRLLAHVRPGYTVGRLGGDEFVILCDQVHSLVGMTALAERINDMLRAPLHLQGHRLFVTASIGLAMGHGTTHSAEEMLRNADAAMYSAKEQGRDGWRFFSEEIHEQVRKRLDITNGLRLALERNEFQVHFQPILSVESRRICGAEMLLRWYPSSGEITPDHFIPIAEMTGSIIPIGKWVFEGVHG